MEYVGYQDRIVGGKSQRWSDKSDCRIGHRFDEGLIGCKKRIWSSFSLFFSS